MEHLRPVFIEPNYMSDFFQRTEFRDKPHQLHVCRVLLRSVG